MAVSLAASHKAELVFCTSINHADAIAKCAVPYGCVDPRPVLEMLDDDAKANLRQAEMRARDAGVCSTGALVEGPPAGAIVAYAKECGADAIVMGTQGKRGLERFVLGSTAAGVLRNSDVPTFVVHAGENGVKPGFKRILVAVDDSEPSAAAVSLATELAAAEDGLLLLCNVAESAILTDNARLPGYGRTPLVEQLHGGVRSLADAALIAKDRGVRADTVPVEGAPVEQLLHAARTLGADLIAIGTHGRRGLQRVLFGSVAEGIVRRSSIPVVVVRVAAQRSAARHPEHSAANA